MSEGLSRQLLQKLSLGKIEDAALLFEAERWSSAYYLAGYAVEFALKACIARRFAAEAIPDKKFVLAVHSHSLKELVGLAGLKAELLTHEGKDSHFAANWGITAQWLPDTRYEQTDKASAQYLIEAIRQPDHGVLKWIQIYW